MYLGLYDFVCTLTLNKSSQRPLALPAQDIAGLAIVFNIANPKGTVRDIIAERIGGR